MRDIGGGMSCGLRSGCTESLGRPDSNSYLFPAGLLGKSEEVSESSAVGGESRWWLVYSKSRQEKALSRGLTQMQVPHYLPIHKREAVTRGRTRVVEEPLFSGYLFLYADAEQRASALTTNRISATTPVEDQQRLREDLVQLARSIAAGARLTLEAKLQPGDWVRVKGGIHEGLEGTVVRRKGQTRLVLAVNFLKQGASLEVHDSLLEKIDPPDQAARAAIEIERRCGR